MEDLRKLYPIASAGARRFIPGSLQHRPMLYAVDGVSFSINRGESVGLVGNRGAASRLLCA